MSEQENMQLAQAGYAAFGRGDIPAFMDLLADDVEWVVPGPADVPIFRTFHGKAGVGEWLGALGTTLQFRMFEPREFIAQGDKVVTLLHTESLVTRTNREISQDLVHVLTIRDGKIMSCSIYENTAATADAYRGR